MVGIQGNPGTHTWNPGGIQGIQGHTNPGTHTDFYILGRMQDCPLNHNQCVSLDSVSLDSGAMFIFNK